MIALDTNVLIRFLVEDDPIQTPRAVRLIEGATERDEPIFLSQVVLCETEWVLTSIYGAGRREVCDILKRILTTPPFVVEEPLRVEECLERYRTKKGDFSDFLLGEASRSAGAVTTFTFDRALRQEVGFTFL